ncbi:coiled-coil domain-containing protein 94 [Tanacetum coccineum]
MAERKVLNKYYPPDFDPANIPKRPIATRFKFQVQDVTTEIKPFKQIRQNADIPLSLELRDILEGVCEEKPRKRDADERGDSMKSLEKRTLDSKREMDILSNLDEIKLHGSKENIRRIDDDNLDDTYDTVFSDLNGSRTSQTGSKKRKVSKSQTDFLSETSTHDKLNYTKEDQSGQLTLKSSVLRSFSTVKNSAWNTCSEWPMLADLVPSSVVYRKTIHRRKNITYLGSNLLLKLSVKEDDGNMVDATVRLYGPNTEYVTNREWELQIAEDMRERWEYLGLGSTTLYPCALLHNWEKRYIHLVRYASPLNETWMLVVDYVLFRHASPLNETGMLVVDSVMQGHTMFKGVSGLSEPVVTKSQGDSYLQIS